MHSVGVASRVITVVFIRAIILKNWNVDSIEWVR